MMDSKACTKCGIVKPCDSFNKDRSRKDGLQDRCRECRNAQKRDAHAKNPLPKREADRRYREGNKDRLSAQNKEYRDNNADTIREQRKAYRSIHADAEKERAKLTRQRHGDRENARAAEWRRANPERVKQTVAMWHADHPEVRGEISKRYKVKILATPKGKLEANISRGIRRGLRKGAKNGRRTFDLLGYTSDELKIHIERQFLTGMTWENYGPVWHIDHEVPLAVHNYQTPDDIDFKRAWAMTNLKPLWGKDNMSKGAKLSAPFQPSLALSIASC